MRRTLRRAAAGLAVALAGCTMPTPPRPAGHVILDREHAIVSAYWQPTEEDVRVLETELAQLIGSRDRRVSGMEHAKLSEYGIRYYGTAVDGRRVIVGRGSHLSQETLPRLLTENDGSGQVTLSAFGGGSLFFTVVYDVGAKRILSIDANAPL